MNVPPEDLQRLFGLQAFKLDPAPLYVRDTPVETRNMFYLEAWKFRMDKGAKCGRAEPRWHTTLRHT
jgi:hypothetical protein